jgi:uncharacterized membrane protein YjjP (DUF1212 family)
VSRRDSAIEFVVTLGRALHVHGAPAPAVEQAMESAALQHGLQGQFFATPTSIFASFPEDPERPYASARTLLLRVEPGSTNLARRARIEAIVRASERGDLSPEKAREQLLAVENDAAPYSKELTVAAFALSAASAAVFFNSTLHETLLAGLIGLMVGCCHLAALRSERAARVLLPGAAFLGASLAGAIESLWGRQPEVSVIVAGLITLLPGLSLTTSLSEVAVGHLASGTARLVGSMMTLLALLFGAAIGGRVGVLLNDPAQLAAAPLDFLLPPGALYAALVLAPLCFGVLFKAPRRDLAWIVAASALAFLGARFGQSLVGAPFSEAVGGFVVCLASNA